MSILAAQIYAILMLVVILFQLALAIGMPWGSLAMGGKFPGRFPIRMRVAAVIQAAILLLLAAIVLSRARVAFSDWFALSTTLIWIVVAFSAISVVLNVITPSKWERIIWAPVTVIQLICCLIVATS